MRPANRTKHSDKKAAVIGVLGVEMDDKEGSGRPPRGSDEIDRTERGKGSRYNESRYERRRDVPFLVPVD